MHKSGRCEQAWDLPLAERRAKPFGNAGSSTNGSYPTLDLPSTPPTPRYKMMTCGSGGSLHSRGLPLPVGGARLTRRHLLSRSYFWSHTIRYGVQGSRAGCLGRVGGDG